MESPYHPHAFELWEILLDSNYLIPVEAGLQQCSFDVLNQCSLGRKQVLKRPGTILEKVMFSFIYTAGTTALAENSLLFYVIAGFCYAKQVFKSFGQLTILFI